MDVMLAKTYKDQSVSGWLLSEKLDGVRAIWTGSKLVSRNGNVFDAPAWFTGQLPAGVVLDGELFAGRRMFQKTVGSVRKQTPIDDEWRALRYCVFDAPEAPGGFEKRLEVCRAAIIGSSVAELVEQVVCKGPHHLRQFAAELAAQGAEGVMLRKPGSAYEATRSANLLKYKHTDSDEAQVIGYQEGKGRHIGRLGALVCRWKEVVFNVGTGLSDLAREAPPAVGQKITFAFNGLTDDGVPRFPVFVCVRDYE